MSKWGGKNEALLTELITANTPPPPPRQPGPPGHDCPCRRPDEGVRDTTVRSPAALRYRRRIEARRVLCLAAAVVVPVLGGLAEQVLR